MAWRRPPDELLDILRTRLRRLQRKYTLACLWAAADSARHKDPEVRSRLAAIEPTIVAGCAGCNVGGATRARRNIASRNFEVSIRDVTLSNAKTRQRAGKQKQSRVWRHVTSIQEDGQQYVDCTLIASPALLADAEVFVPGAVQHGRGGELNIDVDWDSFIVDFADGSNENEKTCEPIQNNIHHCNLFETISPTIAIQPQVAVAKESDLAQRVSVLEAQMSAASSFYGHFQDESASLESELRASRASMRRHEARLSALSSDQQKFEERFDDDIDSVKDQIFSAIDRLHNELDKVEANAADDLGELEDKVQEYVSLSAKASDVQIAIDTTAAQCEQQLDKELHVIVAHFDGKLKEVDGNVDARIVLVKHEVEQRIDIISKAASDNVGENLHALSKSLELLNAKMLSVKRQTDDRIAHLENALVEQVNSQTIPLVKDAIVQEIQGAWINWQDATVAQVQALIDCAGL